jgi:hypothetical protein
LALLVALHLLLVELSAHLLDLLPPNHLLAGGELLLVLLPPLDQVAEDAQVLQLEPDVQHLLVHAVGHCAGLPRRLRSLLPPQVHLLLAARVVTLEDARPLQPVDVAAQQHVHRLQPHHHVVSGAASAVADPAAVRTQPVRLLFAVFVVLQAVAAVFAAAHVLIICIASSLLYLL